MTVRAKGLSTTVAGTVAVLLIAGCGAAQPSATTEPSDLPESVVQEESNPALDTSDQVDQQSEQTTDEGVSEQQISIPWITEETTGEPAVPEADTVLVTGMRLGEHEDFDRIVVDLTGDSAPGWVTRWTTDPAEEGRGEPLDISGSEFLDIVIKGVRIPETDEDWAVVYDDFSTRDFGDISVIYDGTYEGRAHLVVGMSQKQPYRIFQLSNPNRVIIDVQRTSGAVG